MMAPLSQSKEDDMARKIILGGVLGGLALFVWGMLSHTVLGLTDSSVKSLPNETAMLQGLQESLKAPALYAFPSGGMMEAPPEQKDAAMKAWSEAYRRGPRGLLVYETAGGNPSMASLLLTQLGINILVCLIAAWVLAQAAPALPVYGKRVCLVSALGLLASVLVDGPYWNWYSFPAHYTLMAIVDRTVGMTAAGLVIARFVKS
jgi:hypothetical protein